MKQNKGITLITLVITIILLIILAGVVINLSLGDKGLFNKAKQAKEEYSNAQEKEQKELNDLYSEMLIATNDNAQITISVADLKTLIAEEVKKQLKEYGSNEIYPVLYKNNDGWNSGSITIEGLSEYEEIGIYFDVSGSTDVKENMQMIRCQKTSNGYILGGYNTISLGSNTLCYNCVNLTFEGNTLTYGKCARVDGTTVRKDNKKIYKIVGLTKSSQIVE